VAHALASRNATTIGRKRTRSRWFLPALAVVLIGLAAFLLYRTLSGYRLDEITAALTAIPAHRIALAGLFAACSYLCLTCFDWLALRYVGHNLPYPRVALASFCSLSLGHNIGFAALSSGAIRYRFYSRWGVSGGDIAKIILFCGVTVGLGLMLLGACALLFRSGLAATITGLPQTAVFTVGIACLGLAAVYVALCATVRKPVHIRDWHVELPPLRLALAQLVIGPINFAFVAACLHQALAGVGDVSYLGTAAVYVIANVTALISHVPGGLGVIETVVHYLLPAGNVIGALVAFRVIYYLVPLGIGGPLFGLCELILKGRKSRAAKSAR
jgi:glycosyltransferase 2 family protein